MLKAQGLRSVRDGQQILANVDVIVEPGESLAVTGPSGSGKTTLLSLLSGLARPTAGEVYIDGQPLTSFAGPALGVAVVLQGYGLVSLLTAAENIEVAMRAAGRSPAVATRAAREMLAHLGLEAHADQLVEELSGGQQQRTAVARALALEPRLLIADEPTAELDPAARAVALARMFEVALNGGSLILATHDPEVAARCDRILDLSEGSPATGSPPGQAAVGQPPPDPVSASPAPPDQAGADQLSAPRPAIELSTLRPLAAEPRAPADRPAEEPPAAEDLPADQATPGQLPAEPPPLHQAAPGQPDRAGPGRRPAPWHKPAHALPPAVTPGHQLPPAVPPEDLSAQRERLISSALPPMHRRGARLRSYLDEVRRRAYQASAWLDARDRQAQQAGSAGLSPAAEAGAGERELLSLARDDLAGFADLGLRLLELHQPMGLGAGTGDPSSSVSRCLTCMWRWPCPTFLTLAEIMEDGPGQA